MKLKKTETKVIEVEIEIPYYCGVLCHSYLIYVDKNCIVVTDLFVHYGISITYASIPLDGVIENITKEHFDKQYIKVNKLINSNL